MSKHVVLAARGSVRQSPNNGNSRLSFAETARNCGCPRASIARNGRLGVFLRMFRGYWRAAAGRSTLNEMGK